MNKSYQKYNSVIDKCPSNQLQIVPSIPIFEDTEDDQTILFSTYYGDRMTPTLKTGDQVILKKVNTDYIEWGEVFMLQLQDCNVFCRLNQSEVFGSIMISYDKPGDNIKQDLPMYAVKHIWQLKALARIN